MSLTKLPVFINCASSHTILPPNFLAFQTAWNYSISWEFSTKSLRPALVYYCPSLLQLAHFQRQLQMIIVHFFNPSHGFFLIPMKISLARSHPSSNLYHVLVFLTDSSCVSCFLSHSCISSNEYVFLLIQFRQRRVHSKSYVTLLYLSY